MQKNSKKPTLFFLLLDAFRWDYCNKEDSPILYNMRNRGIWIKKLLSSPGFAQRSAIFTGASPNIHGNFTLYSYDPKNSPYKILNPFINLLNFLSQSKILFKIIKKIINQIPKITTDYAPPGWIPFKVLPLISVTEDVSPIYKPNSFSIESIFDKFIKYNISYKYFMAPVPKNDEWAMKKISLELQDKVDAYFLQFSDSDGKMHKLGSEGKERRNVVKSIDQRIQKIKQILDQKFDNYWFVIVGDHGMMDVKEYIDVWGPVIRFAKSNNLIFTKDFLMFLDSTLARFWFFNKKTEEIMHPFLVDFFSSTKGSFVTKDFAYQKKIPFHDKRYGDLIWIANPGIGIFPDYFHSLEEKYKAMHGYNSHCDKMKGAAIIYNKHIKKVEIEEGDLKDLCATICDILKIPYPNQNEGTSFVQKI